MPYTVVLVDTTGIQKYIFASNRLREQIGASYLVGQATGRWALDTLPTPHNVVDSRQVPPLLDPARTIESGELAAEVVYAGGGNLLGLFAEPDAAQAFVGRLTRRVLCEAPGLALTTASRDFTWDNCSLSQVLADLSNRLAERKREHPTGYPMLGLGVTAQCVSTGWPAVGERGSREDQSQQELFSADTLAKIDAADLAEATTRSFFGLTSFPNEAYFPDRSDELGRSPGQDSHVAVVHADGNGMGKRLARISKDYQCPDGSKNRQLIDKLRSFSIHLTVAARDAQRVLVKRLLQHSEESQGTSDPFRLERLTRQDGRICLPMRPLIFGGDDVTFLADGRLGLDLAVSYLRAFEDAARDLPGDGPATAAAGVAMVKSHYPLARAYDLSKELCSQAKRLRRESGFTAAGSTLDWHFAMGGLAGTLDEIRSREYQVANGTLTLRPVVVTGETNSNLRTWSTIEHGILGFRSASWHGRQNKLKALREALRAGPAAVELFLSRLGDETALPEVLPGYPRLREQGWHGGHCAYFDAIEAEDWFVDLDPNDRAGSARGGNHG